MGGAVAAGAVAVATVVVLAGGSGGSGSPEAGPPPVGAHPGQRAPQVALRTAGGDADEVVLGGGGTDLVVASFLAPGCPSCGAEVPSLRKVREAFPNAQLKVVIVDMSGAPMEQADAIAAYYRDRLGGGDELVYAVDPQFDAVGAYEVRSLGTTVVLDGAGNRALPR